MPAVEAVRSSNVASAEEAAKRAWLAKLDAPTWGKAAEAVAAASVDAVATQALEEKCDEGDAVACDTLSKEEEAKRAWLARLDAPTWGKAASSLTEIAGASAA